jgi:hypothetical protein
MRIASAANAEFIPFATAAADASTETLIISSDWR